VASGVLHGDQRLAEIQQQRDKGVAQDVRVQLVDLAGFP
jgi:hypothetical protein